MTHRIFVVLCFFVATSLAVAADEGTPDFPRVPATPPEKVGDTFRTLAGFRMELLAAEPLVTDPVAMAYDENGRAFVAEMNDYPYTDAATHQAWKDNTTDAPIGRIRLLIDTDGDGDFDRSTLFAENLSWPTGVACFKGGIFVAATPDVWYLKDTNGDGKADVRRKVYTGFRKFNVQAVMNNLAWGLDNCIYGAGGSNGGKVLPGEKPDAEPITLSRNDFRFDPVSERFEPIPGGARFGNAFDDWGNRFVCNIRNPAQHVLVESRYLARNPHVSVASVVHDVADSGDALPVYRVSPLEKWRDVRANRFAAERATQPRSELVGGGVVTSASGITVYRGDAYPPEFRGQLFIGEVANNLIHRQVMRPDGVTFASRRVDEKTDFVASTDVWFRPVNFVNAPDGTLHVLDMYREVIEHPWSIPDDIRAKLDLRSGADRGRIFRLAPQGFRAGKVPKLDDAATGELADTLRNPNSWWRETAQRLIFERQDREAVEPLQKLLADAKEPLARLHALWTLEGLGAAAEADILRAMNDAEPGVRENAIRVAERHLKGSTTLLDRLLKATEDAELRVRFQAVLTLGESADPRVVDALATVAKRDASDPWMTVAILSGSNGRGGELMGKLIADDAFATSAAGGVFLRQLAVSVGGANEPAEVSRVLASLATNEKTALSVASGLGEGLRRKSGTLRKVAEGDAAVSAALEKLFNSAAKTAADPNAAVADRVRATGLLAFEEFDRVKPLLNDLLDPRQPPELQRAAVAALSGSHDGAIGPLLLSRWASYTPAVRTDVMAAMLSYPNRLSPLLDAVEAGRVRVGDIPASRRAATTQHANEQIRTRALKLFGEDTKVERKQIIEKYTPALDLPGDPAAGRKTYQTLCATCHRLGDEGNDVGPNLATVRQWGPQQLLVNIVDPHREVAPGFAEYVVQLVDGETLSGIVTEESGTSITLKLAGGAQRVLPRQNVKLISGSRLSLMPEGLETGLSLQQMADLIALLRSAPQEQNKLSFDDQWTPKGHLGKGDLPEEKEADWIDGRSREMDFGPFVTTSLVVPELGVPRKPFVDRKTPGDERNALPGDERVVKALAIKLGGSGSEGRAGVLFDKTTMTLRCGWTGKFLEHSSLRYGLLEAPQIGGDLAFVTVPDAWESGDAPGGTLPREWQGLYRNGRDVVLAYTVGGRTVRELNDVDGSGERAVFARTMEVGPGTTPLTLTVAKQDRRKTFVAATGAELSTRDGRTILSIPARNAPTPIRVFLSAAEIPDVTDAIAPLDRLNAPRQRIWGEPLVTKGQLGKPALGSPFAVDTITMPYDNPHKALFFAGGFDFAPDGSCYVCTAHGDVWRVTGIDEDLDEIRWQRFATGLYQPLGLKVRDGAVFVLGRDQVTRLHDANADGEADFYENVNDDCTDQGQPHAYAMCLETDAAGNFYFLKSGAPKTPHGGTLLKLSADGKELSVFATGFRHADGLSISPDGATITTADNEGNWVPVTRLDIVERGKFYGHVPTAHVTPEPTGPGEPLCWLPRVIDNSAGGQAWVPDGAWGSLSGALLHFSFGRCTANVILKEQVDGVWQGGAVVLPTGQFLSGVHRGRFVGNVLYLCGLNGWSSEAAKDGCFQRVRYVGGPIPLPTGVHVYANGIELTFAEPLDAKLAADPKRYAVEAWNYRWSREYGSKDYLPSDPTREGRATLNVTRAVPSSDGRSVFLTVERLAPVMQLRLQAGLRTAAGAALPVEYYGTIHRLRAARP